MWCLFYQSDKFKYTEKLCHTFYKRVLEDVDGDVCGLARKPEIWVKNKHRTDQNFINSQVVQYNI